MTIGLAAVGRPDAERLLGTFLRLVRVDSPSYAESALAELLVDDLRRLGWRVELDGTGQTGGNVIATLDGDDALDPLLFTSHMDVVMPCHNIRPHVADGTVQSGGDTVLGADAKASIAALLEMAAVLAGPGAAQRRPPLEVVITWGEEAGHAGAKALDANRLRARRAYVLDGLVPVGTIVIAAPEYQAFSIRVIGRAAHAGVEPERGVSAISVAAQALTQLPWGRLDEATTANVGTVAGGSVRNAVPAEVRLEGEVRGHDSARVASCERGIRAAFESAAVAAGAQVEVGFRQMYTAYALAPDDPVVELASGAFATLDGGGSSELVRTGGGSDANELNDRGLRACVLGIGAERCHSVAERISLAELQRLTEWILAIVHQAGRADS